MHFNRADWTAVKRDPKHTNLQSGTITFAAGRPAACTEIERMSSFAKLRTLLGQHDGGWMLFVGDSDTRYFVLELLQMIATATYSSDVAALAPSLWLGVETHEDFIRHGEKLDWMRRCLVDFVFNASGHQVSSQSTSCTAGSKSDSYVALGRDYNLSTMSLPEAGLRVTYVGTSMWTQALQTLKGLTSHLATASVSARPSVLYASVGAWMMYVNDMRLHAQVANLMHTALDGLANLIASPQVLIYGTTLGMHNRNQTFDQRFLLPLLHNKSQLRREASEWNEARPARDDARRGHWRLFDRSNHALSWNVTADGRRGIRAANGHAPPLVNYVDWLRMFALDLFRPSPILHDGAMGLAKGYAKVDSRINSRDPASSLNGSRAGCANSKNFTRLLLHFSPWCVGFGRLHAELAARNKTKTGVLGPYDHVEVFGEVYFHFCNASLHVL